ncbi:MAG: hypothetical protein HY866_06345 [Chloroflexi bacterium]|nr:hypothetical protein [Chloroflexota bacterium]
MKIKLTVAVFVLCALILAPGLAAAQGPLTPEEVVQVLLDAELIASDEGEVVLEVEEETIDLATEDNYFSYFFYEDVDAENIVMSANITWGPGAAEDDCGLVLRGIDNDNYYYVGFSQDNQVRFDEITDGEWQDPQFFDTEVIVAGEGKTNNILAIALTGSIIVVVNNEPVTQIEDDTLAGGWVGVGMDTYDTSAATSCVFSDIWAWEPAKAASTGLTGMLGGSSDVVQLSDYRGEPAQVMSELEDLGIVPNGGSQVFFEDYAYFTGAGSFFTPLARNSPFTNVVMGGELTFTVGTTSDTEACTLMARVITGANGSDTYIEVGFDNEGQLYGIDLDGGEMVMGQVFAEGVKSSAVHHVLFIANDDKLTVFLDGDLVANEVQLSDPRSGTFGIALTGKASSAKCEGHNIWVYELD